MSATKDRRIAETGNAPLRATLARQVKSELRAASDPSDPSDRSDSLPAAPKTAPVAYHVTTATGGSMIQVTDGVITAAMPPHRAWKGRPWAEFVKEVNAITITNLTRDGGASSPSSTMSTKSTSSTPRSKEK